jgi:hypothetical protein
MHGTSFWTFTFLPPSLLLHNRLEKGNVMNNMYVDVRIHAISNVELENQTYEADLKIEVSWTDDSDWTKKREADYADMKKFIKQQNKADRYFEATIPSARVDYSVWDANNSNAHPKNRYGEEFGGLYHDVRNIVHNYNEQKDVFPPYLSHFMDRDKGAGNVKNNCNVRVLFRREFKLRMRTVDLKYFPYDSLQLPIELRYDKDPSIRLVMQHKRGGATLGLQGKKYPYKLEKSAIDAGETEDDKRMALANVGHIEGGKELYVSGCLFIVFVLLPRGLPLLPIFKSSTSKIVRLVFISSRVLIHSLLSFW